MSGTVIFLSGEIFSPYCLKKVERRQESLKDREQGKIQTQSSLFTLHLMGHLHNPLS